MCKGSGSLNRSLLSAACYCGDAWRTPVVGKGRIQTLCFSWVHPPESLARHPIQEVVARTRCRTCRRRELSRIVGGAELIQPGISFSGFRRCQGSDRGCLLAWSKPQSPKRSIWEFPLNAEPGPVGFCEKGMNRGNRRPANTRSFHHIKVLLCTLPGARGILHRRVELMEASSDETLNGR